MFSEEQRKQMMAYAYRKQEELKVCTVHKLYDNNKMFQEIRVLC